MKAGHASHAFPKNLRLLKRSEFQRVYEEGQRRSGPLGAAFFRPNGLGWTRLGITVPSRVGNAVMRNRIKRRIREVFRLHRAWLAEGWDVVLNPRQGVVRASFPTLAKELMRLFPPTPPEPGALGGATCPAAPSPTKEC